MRPSLHPTSRAGQLPRFAELRSSARFAFLLLGPVLLLLTSLGAPAAVAQTAPTDPQSFASSGFRVDDAFWSYFQQRGAEQSFGQPISRAFTLNGLTVQLFERALLQQQADGSVLPANLLDAGGYFPYTSVNGSTFPAPDPALAMVTPSPDQPQYLDRMTEFLRAVVPDEFQSQPVGFFSTVTSSVTCGVAFPNAPCQQNLLPYMSLEVWGAPISMAAADPRNPNFIYQRFQRGILMYDAGCQCSQGVLVGSYLKAILTGQGLPSDLAGEAAKSPLLRQYNPARPNSLNNAAVLQNTDLTNAFSPDTAPGS